MEQLLHYCWKHKLFQPYDLTTTEGKEVEIIDTGLHNTNAGPDFFNAKVKIDGTMWVGNIEIHDKSTDWYLHNHDKDPRYYTWWKLPTRLWKLLTADYCLNLR